MPHNDAIWNSYMRLTQCELLIGRTDLLFYGHVQKTKWRSTYISRALCAGSDCRFCVGWHAGNKNQADPRRSSAKKSLQKGLTEEQKTKQKKRLWGRSRSFIFTLLCQKKEFLADLRISGLEANHEQSHSCETKCTANKKSAILTNHCNVPEVYRTPALQRSKLNECVLDGDMS